MNKSFGPKTKSVEIFIERLKNIKWFDPPEEEAQYESEVEASIQQHFDRLNKLGFLADTKLSKLQKVQIEYIKSDWRNAGDIHAKNKSTNDSLYNKMLNYTLKIVKMITN